MNNWINLNTYTFDPSQTLGMDMSLYICSVTKACLARKVVRFLSHFIKREKVYQESLDAILLVDTMGSLNLGLNFCGYLENEIQNLYNALMLGNHIHEIKSQRNYKILTMNEKWLS